MNRVSQFIRAIVMGLFLLPLSAHAKFESSSELMKAFAQAGLDTVVEFPGGDFTSGPRMKIHEIVDKEGNKQTKSLSTYAKGNEKRLSELDYVENNKAILSQLISGKIYAEAYQVSEIFLCYRLPASYLEQIKHTVPKYITCYLFPMQISEVVQAIKAANNIP